MERSSRITQLRISGMRVIEDVTLDLGGLTVLIGDNGTGKSSIVEALKLLHLASQQAPLTKYGGFPALLRRGAQPFRVGARFQSKEGAAIDYDVEFRSSSTAGLSIRARSPSWRAFAERARLWALPIRWAEPSAAAVPDRVALRAARDR